MLAARRRAARRERPPHAHGAGGGRGRMTPPRYGPPDASRAPRYTGVRTFARCPHVADPDGVDVAVVGVPVRHRDQLPAGRAVRPRGDPLGLDRSCGPTTRRSTWTCSERSRSSTGAISTSRPATPSAPPARSRRGSSRSSRRASSPLVLGGDHSIVLGELRAQAAVHGPVALVLLDAHADTWDSYYGERYFHGTPFRRAVEEGLLAPERSLLAGMRGPLYSAADLGEARELGFDIVAGDELRAMDAGRVRAAACATRVGEAPAFFSFDIDVIDPAFAPATGTPEVGGPAAARGARLHPLAGRHAVRRASTWSRSRRPTTGPARRRPSLAASDRLRVPGADRGRGRSERPPGPDRPLSAGRTLCGRSGATTSATSASGARRGCAGTSLRRECVPALPGHGKPARGARRGPRGDRPVRC